MMSKKKNISETCEAEAAAELVGGAARCSAGVQVRAGAR
jgi:hypothetical protein